MKCGGEAENELQQQYNLKYYLKYKKTALRYAERVAKDARRENS